MNSSTPKSRPARIPQHQQGNPTPSGLTFGSTFPKLAKMTDKLAIVRSYQSRNAGHLFESHQRPAIR